MAKRSADDAALLCRGGSSQKAKWVQALASDEAPALVIGKTSSQPATPSKLSAFLIEKWGWGLISAPFLQQVASLSVEDGANHPDLKVLAKLGTSGKYPGKCHGELVAKLNPMSIDHALTNFTIWYRVGRKLKGCTHYALLPHELFALLYSQHRDAFTEHIMGGSADNLPKFWKAMVNHPALRDHPMCKISGYQSKFIPLALHGDGVAVSGVGRSWSRSIDVWSFSSVIGRGMTILTNFIIFLLFPNYICKSGVDSMGAWEKRMCWSFYWLAVGKWPTKYWNGSPIYSDKAGTDLADGFRAVLWSLRSDLDFMKKGLNLEAANSHTPCTCCLANTSDIPWTDHKDTAAWISTIWACRVAWLAAHPMAHLLFKKVPGLSILNFVPDVMHVLHLGVYMYFFGSVLKYLTHHIMDGDPDINIETLYSQIKQLYSDYDITSRFNDLRVSMYWNGESGEFPVLKGKAAEVRNLVKPLLVVAHKYLAKTSPTNKIILKQLEMAVRIEMILDTYKNDYVFPTEARAEFKAACFTFAQLNTALGQEFHTKGVFLFHHTIKMHYLCHIGLVAEYMNPRLSWCYSGEDLMHIIKELVQGSYAGTGPLQLPPKVMRKYAVGFGLKLQRRALL